MQRTNPPMAAKSFAYIAKEELCTLDIQNGRAELAAAIVAAAAIEGSGRDALIRFSTENLPVARRMLRIITTYYPCSASVRRHKTRQRFVYTVEVPQAALLLGELSLGGTQPHLDVPTAWLGTAEHRIAVLRGAFLACGSISNPKKNYHLEFAASSRRLAETLRGILSEFAIRANIVPRKENFVLYLNEGDSIAALLALIGAHTSILNLENVRILKETRNNVNRAVNCETANINKTVNAAQTQVDSIRRIEQTMGLSRLSSSLREAAELRLEHPEASLQELCELCGTTKSGMNHRLRKINAIARSLSEEV